MIKEFKVEAFKSLENVAIELGQINVFIGANGSGKSNILEALGVLSAAASGRVNDESLIYRGVRPGVPSLYKCAFKGRRSNPYILLTAITMESASYSVTLHNPIEKPEPAWKYNTERWEYKDFRAGRSNRSKEKMQSETGLAALQLEEGHQKDPAAILLKSLQSYSIYTPTTTTLRGLTSGVAKDPLGLSGESLPQALLGFLKQIKGNDFFNEKYQEALDLIDWAESVDSAPSSSIPLSPSLTTSSQIIRFTDRYMVKERNRLSGADASEGALYILFMTLMALHDRVPALYSIDNADHGLNPRLARRLIELFCSWVLENSITQRQVLLTTHNPLVLDGLPLWDDRVRLFMVDRTSSGRTVVTPFIVTGKVRELLKSDGALSRAWVMGHIGGVPNV